MDLIKAARYSVKKTRNILQSVLLSYPKKVQCNICGWEGRRFLSDSWHKYINCPKCRSGIRHRLFIASLQNIEQLSFDIIFNNKKVLHFAPEDILTSNIQGRAAHYVTADYLRQDCDLKLDMSEMSEIKNESFDVIIAFDVLEHVPDYTKAIAEVHRVLTAEGIAILTVPQKDNLRTTYEDSNIISPEDRTKHFGQYDHLRIFGNDFSNVVEKKGFSVTVVDESIFSEPIRNKHVLFPPVLSNHPMATNYRKIFFCRKKP